MDYYIQGNAAKAEQIKAAFEKLGYSTSLHVFFDTNTLYATIDGSICECSANGSISRIIKTHPDYKELELSVEPKFKVGDKVLDNMMIVTVREVVYDQNYKEYKYGIGSYWVFESALKPYKPHYDIANFKPFDKVLVRDNDRGKWRPSIFSYRIKGRQTCYPFCCIGNSFSQCIPFDGNEHLLGTTDMCGEEYINW